MGLVIEGGISLGKGIELMPTVPVDSTLDLGTQVDWTANTIFDTWTSSSSTTTDGTNNVNCVWQMFYAHKALRITSGTSGARIGTHTSGTNSWTWQYAISTDYNSQTNFTSPSTISTGGASYSSGATYASNYSATVSVPAKKYFLIGRVFGPFYYASRTLASNRTAVIGGVPYFTVINKLWRGGDAATPMTIPTQLGGSSGTWTVATSISQVAGFRFDVP